VVLSADEIVRFLEVVPALQAAEPVSVAASAGCLSNRNAPRRTEQAAALHCGLLTRAKRIYLVAHSRHTFNRISRGRPIHRVR
jgi:hypothetical protein